MIKIIIVVIKQPRQPRFFFLGCDESGGWAWIYRRVLFYCPATDYLLSFFGEFGFFWLWFWWFGLKRCTARWAKFFVFFKRFTAICADRQSGSLFLAAISAKRSPGFYFISTI
jgi:hypothetical protein